MPRSSTAVVPLVYVCTVRICWPTVSMLGSSVRVISMAVAQGASHAAATPAHRRLEDRRIGTLEADAGRFPSR